MDATTTGRLTLGQPARSVIEAAGNKDWFATDLIAGKTDHVMILGVGWFGGTLSESDQDFTPETISCCECGNHLHWIKWQNVWHIQLYT